MENRLLCRGQRTQQKNQTKIKTKPSDLKTPPKLIQNKQENKNQNKITNKKNPPTQYFCSKTLLKQSNTTLTTNGITLEASVLRS